MATPTQDSLSSTNATAPQECPSSMMATHPQQTATLPSARWTSLDDWDYNGMKERIESLLAKLNKSALVRHTESILGTKVTLSDPFSAGQYWVCFEMVAQNSDLIVIARVRLPKHPDIPEAWAAGDPSGFDFIKSEVDTMQYIKDHLPSIPVPKVYAFPGPSSKHAEDAGAAYMLIEGFRGNTLQDIELDMTCLPIQTQERIITQWTAVQVAVASLKFPAIGSINATSTGTAQPTLGPLSCAAIDGLKDPGPFLDSLSYFKEVAKARYTRACQNEESFGTKLACMTFIDVVDNTAFFTSNPEDGFSLNHMDMGPQNILVDESFKLLAVIDWEFAQTAPWQVNHYPVPFSLMSSDAELEEILRDPDHIAYGNISRKVATQKMYQEKMKQAEEEMAQKGHPPARSIADSLNGVESRIYACFERISGDDENDQYLACEMVRMAYGLDLRAAKQYLGTIPSIKNKVDAPALEQVTN